MKPGSSNSIAGNHSLRSSRLCLSSSQKVEQFSVPVVTLTLPEPLKESGDNRSAYVLLAIRSPHGEATDNQDQASEAGPQNCTGEGQSNAAYPPCQKAAHGEKGSDQA